MNAYEQMREALVAMVKSETDGTMTRDDLCGRCIDRLHGHCKHDGSCWVDKVINAVALPRRNCDVGTPDEQEARRKAFCYSQSDCYNCPLTGFVSCRLAWAQMPYSEKRKGEGDGNK